MPSLLLAEVQRALAASAAPRVFICNVATQVGETEGYSLADHIDALRRHDLLALIDGVLVNDNFDARAPEHYPAAPVRIDVADQADGPRLLLRDVVDSAKAHHHDPRKLAAALMAVLASGELRRRAGDGRRQPALQR
jgi:uncharacterized cofD-like protein